MRNYNTYDDAALIDLLQTGDMAAYECIYNKYWPLLYAYVYNRLKSKEITEEIVQEVFFSLWNRRAALQLTQTLSAYLYTAVKYQIFNYMKADKVRKTYAGAFSRYNDQLQDNSNEEYITYADLANAVEKEVSRLPEKCQQVFRMSRNEHRSIQDIAAALNISHKTVENHLTKALKHLRLAFREYFWLF
ncbi:RNA polymerase sigma-70 factor, ECF subfamily [Chitinophaga sp. YR627]|nr:RNA polymerase sigma-70 factor, ECF subfamily [Chitinophaga sp. YR627]